MYEYVIDVQNLSHSYKTFEKSVGFFNAIKDFINRPSSSVPALNEISFCVRPGEMVGLLGPNGAGKTTLLKILSGLIYPTSGEVSVMGHIPHKKERNFVQHFGMVMGQKSQLLWDIPAIDTLHIIRELYQIPKQVFKQNLDEFMSLLSVSHLLKTPVRNLSLGERMKFELIVSMIHQPKLLFLDEPTIGLDIVSQKAIRDFLQEINLKHKTTIIITSHYMRDIEVLAKRVLIIKRGSIFYDSSLKDLLKNFGDSRKIYFTTEKTEFNLSMPFEKISQIEYSINCIPLDLQKNILEIVNQIPITSVRTEETSLEEAIFSIFYERKGF